MRDQNMKSPQLVCTWQPVRDERGRIRMEARWALPATPAVSTPRHHAA